MNFDTHPGQERCNPFWSTSLQFPTVGSAAGQFAQLNSCSSSRGGFPSRDAVAVLLICNLPWPAYSLDSLCCPSLKVFLFFSYFRQIMSSLLCTSRSPFPALSSPSLCVKKPRTAFEYFADLLSMLFLLLLIMMMLCQRTPIKSLHFSKRVEFAPDRTRFALMMA